MHRAGCDAEARSEMEMLAALTAEALLSQSLTDAFRGGERIFSVRFRQHDGKPIAAIARHDIGIAHQIRQQLGHFLERLAADAMPKAIVDLLETIQINEGDRNRRPVA